MRGRLAVLLLLAPAVLWAAKAIPPSPYNYVHNEAVVSAAAEQRLTAALRQYEQTTHHQFVVALFQGLDGESLEDYSNKVFRAWKVGSAKGNDGLLFCLFKQDRKWRVEVGYGMEGVVTDLQAGVIAREQGVPHFKGGDFDGGVQAVVDALIAKAEGRVPQPPAAAPAEEFDFGAGLWFFLVVFVIIMSVIQRLMVWTQGPKARNSGMFFIDFTSNGGSGGGGWSSGGGGFSGGGGSSGGGGASGGW